MTCCGWNADEHCNYLIDTLILEVSTMDGQPRVASSVGASLIEGALEIETSNSALRLEVYSFKVTATLDNIAQTTLELTFTVTYDMPATWYQEESCKQHVVDSHTTRAVGDYTYTAGDDEMTVDFPPHGEFD